MRKLEDSRWKLLLAIGVALTEFLIPSVAFSQTAHDLIDRCLAHRKELISGVFRATGRDIREKFGGPAIEREVQIDCAFDFSKDSFRFDRLGPAREGRDAYLSK